MAISASSIASVGGAAAQTLGKGMVANASRKGDGSGSAGRMIENAVAETKSAVDQVQRDLEKKKEGTVQKDTAPDTSRGVPMMKKGGRIHKTGVYNLHKGEFVLPARVVKRLDKTRKTSRKSGR
jgi:hypothetical protein